jgi:hypothetical protein
MKIIKTICDKCKSIISNEPEWVKKLEQDMLLETWYEHNGNWHKRTEAWQTIQIIRVDANMIFYRYLTSTAIQISMPGEFNKGYTIKPQ